MLDYRVRHSGWRAGSEATRKVLTCVQGRVARQRPHGATPTSRAAPAGASGWWDWKPVQHALHYLWMTGRSPSTRGAISRSAIDLVERAMPAVAGMDAVPPRVPPLAPRALAPRDGGRHRDRLRLPHLPAFGPGARREALRAMLERGEVREIGVEGKTARWFALARDLPALARGRGAAPVARHDAPRRRSIRSSGIAAERPAVRLRLPDRGLHARAPSACTATTRCRSSTTAGSSGASTPRPTAPSADWRCVTSISSRGWRRTAPRRPAWGAVDQDAALAGVADALCSLATFVAGDETLLRRVTPHRWRAPLARALRERPAPPK